MWLVALGGYGRSVGRPHLSSVLLFDEVFSFLRACSHRCFGNRVKLTHDAYNPREKRDERKSFTPCKTYPSLIVSIFLPQNVGVKLHFYAFTGGLKLKLLVLFYALAAAVDDIAGTYAAGTDVAATDVVAAADDAACDVVAAADVASATNVGLVPPSGQAPDSAIKAGDEVAYTPSGEDSKQERAKVVKVHPDVGGAHYTIRTMGKDSKEKNTDAAHISKVCLSAYKQASRLLKGKHAINVALVVFTGVIRKGDCCTQYLV